MNEALCDPLKYEEIGIGKLSAMLAEANKNYNEKVDRFLELEEFFWVIYLCYLIF